MAKLSNKQNTRFGGLVAVLSGREPYDYIMKDLTEQGFVGQSHNGVFLTNKGMNEKDRLATLAGLMVEKDRAFALKSKK
tara:strand:- start:4505 stop:4741 length:237 start_codon:yes stop_codon:yes gene_type:complete